MNFRVVAFVLSTALAVLSAPPASAESRSWDLGLRLDVLTGTGEPTNDVISQGVFGHRQMNDRWTLGWAVDHSSEFDVERIAKLVGLAPDPDAKVIDAKGTGTAIQVWLEQRSGSDEGTWEWFWGGGLGINEVDIDDQSGPLPDGADFDIRVEAGTELLLTGLIGIRRRLSGSLVLEAALRAEQHVSDWALEDRVSGRRSTVDDYLLSGVHVGVLWKRDGD